MFYGFIGLLYGLLYGVFVGVIGIGFIGLQSCYWAFIGFIGFMGVLEL